MTKEGIKFEGSDTITNLDTIILATGFDTFNFLGGLQISGVKGQTLKDLWPDGVAKALKGIMIPEIPNFGMLYGPNTNLSHNSLILVIEAQARCLAAMVDKVFQARGPNGTLAIYPKREITEKYWEKLQTRLQNSSFSDPNCTSWWRRHDGIIVNNWPGTAIDYQRLLEEVKWQDFEVKGSESQRLLEDIKKQDVQSIPRIVEEAWLSRGTLAAFVIGGIAAGFTLHRVLRLRLI